MKGRLSFKSVLLVLSLSALLLAACQGRVNFGVESPFGSGDVTLDGKLSIGNDESGSESSPSSPGDWTQLQLDDPTALLILVVLGLVAMVAISRR
jgi:hypothetical protein